LKLKLEDLPQDGLPLSQIHLTGLMQVILGKTTPKTIYKKMGEDHPEKEWRSDHIPSQYAESLKGYHNITQFRAERVIQA